MVGHNLMELTVASGSSTISSTSSSSPASSEIWSTQAKYIRVLIATTHGFTNQSNMATVIPWRMMNSVAHLLSLDDWHEMTDPRCYQLTSVQALGSAAVGQFQLQSRPTSWKRSSGIILWVNLEFTAYGRKEECCRNVHTPTMAALSLVVRCSLSQHSARGAQRNTDLKVRWIWTCTDLGEKRRGSEKRTNAIISIL